MQVRPHLRRSPVTGGVCPGTWERYCAVFDKMVPFMMSQGIRGWNQLNKAFLESYAAWLDDRSYAYRTEVLELTTIKQTVNFLINAGHLPAECRIQLPLTRPPEPTRTAGGWMRPRPY